MNKFISAIAMSFVLLAAPAAHAVDGCKVMLCIAGNWRNISACIPDVEQSIRDSMFGHPWPTCAMASAPSSDGSGSSTSSAGGASMVSMSTSEASCPPMYQILGQGRHGYISCGYPNMVLVAINGQWWSTMYWNPSGGYITSYSPTAEAQLGQGNYDAAFDEALAAWAANHADEN